MRYKCEKCGGDIRSVQWFDQPTDSYLEAALSLHEEKCDGQTKHRGRGVPVPDHPIGSPE